MDKEKMTRKQAISLGLEELNIANGFKRTAEEIEEIATILDRDLEGESAKTISLAFDKIRKNARFWPKVSEILEACDSVRSGIVYKKYSEIEKKSEQVTPGTGILFNIFSRQKRSPDEFKAAQSQFKRIYYQYIKEHKPWPKDEAGLKQLIYTYFGQKPENDVNFSLPSA